MVIQMGLLVLEIILDRASAATIIDKKFLIGIQVDTKGRANCKTFFYRFSKSLGKALILRLLKKAGIDKKVKGMDFNPLEKLLVICNGQSMQQC